MEVSGCPHNENNAHYCSICLRDEIERLTIDNERLYSQQYESADWVQLGRDADRKIERLTAESKAKDVAYATLQEYVTELETRIEVLESQLESGMAGYSMLPTEMLNQLQARVEELEGDVRTHFEHGWSRGFHAGSAQVNTLPSDWRGYRAIIEQGEKDEL